MARSRKSKEFLRRSRAAKKGWETRRKRERVRIKIKRRRNAQRGKLVDHILTVSVTSIRPGSPPRTTTRDVIVPAKPGTTKADLLYLAKKYQSNMPKKDRYSVDLLDVKGRTVTIAEGPKSRGKKVSLR